MRISLLTFEADRVQGFNQSLELGDLDSCKKALNALGLCHSLQILGRIDDVVCLLVSIDMLLKGKVLFVIEPRVLHLLIGLGHLHSLESHPFGLLLESQISLSCGLT